MSKNVVITSDATFKQDVLQSKLPVIVDFWAVWCGPCVKMAPVFERLANQYQGRVRFVKLNVDENPSIKNRYMVLSIPTFIGFVGGREQEDLRFIGSMSEIEFRARFARILK